MIYNIFFIALISVALFCAWKISITDLRRRIIPDVYLWPLMLTGLILVCWFPWPFGPRVATIGATFGYILATVIGTIFEQIQRHTSKTDDYKSPIGFGDIKLITVGGMYLGPTGLSIALIISCILGAIWGYKKNQKYIPFAPFFLTGGFLALIAIAFLI